MKKVLILLIIISLLKPDANGQPATQKKKYTAIKVTEAPVIDGILNDEIWLSGTWVGDFTQFEPYNGQNPSQRTEFKILFDEDNIYAAIKAYDTSPDSIVSRLTRRDQPDGDLTGVIFDSFHDLRTAFIFGISAGCVKYDFMMTNDGQNEDKSWDPNWWVKTSINEEGWIAEMKIPFSQVRFEKNSGDSWGFQVVRLLFRKDETIFWEHIPKDSPGIVHLFGEISGFEQIKPRKIFDITPYSVLKAETFKAEPDNPFLSSGRRFSMNGGIDAKIGITNNMTMDLTINPDFGQVEADPSEVNLTTFETFFSEKRPFFIEGNNITSFGLGIGDGDVGNDNIFYSRRIGRRPQVELDLGDEWNSEIPSTSTIIGAAKLTGKTKNGLSLGFVEAVTAMERAEIDSAGTRKFSSVEPLSNYFAGRVQKDFNDGNRIIGGIFTSTNRDLDNYEIDFLHSSAYTAGADFTQYIKNRSWMFNINAAFSLVQGSPQAIERTQKSSARYYQRPDNDHTRFDTTRTSLAGSGGRLQLQKLSGHWNFIMATIWKTPGFEINDLGYVREADQILSVLWAGYSQWEPGWIYRRYNINFDVYNMSNFGGNKIGRGFEWNASMTLKNYWSVYTGGNFSGDYVSTNILRGGPLMILPGNTNGRIGFSSDNRKKFVFNVSLNGSRGHGNDNRNFYSSVGATYKPANYISFALNPGFSKSLTELQYVDKADHNTADKYIFASIDRRTLNASFRINLNLSPDLTFQYWGQPFISTGEYFDHKLIIKPDADYFKERFRLFSDAQKTYDGEEYDIDEDLDGSVDYSFENSSFKKQEFLSNLVIRWEYNPGSTVYFVWSQSRSYEGTGGPDYLNDMADLFNGRENTPRNVFLMKFSYRFGMK